MPQRVWTRRAMPIGPPSPLEEAHFGTVWASSAPRARTCRVVAFRRSVSGFLVSKGGDDDSPHASRRAPGTSTAQRHVDPWLLDERSGIASQRESKSTHAASLASVEVCIDTTAREAEPSAALAPQRVDWGGGGPMGGIPGTTRGRIVVRRAARLRRSGGSDLRGHWHRPKFATHWRTLGRP